MNCIVVVFDSPTYANSLEDIGRINASDVKEICDFYDRWKVFNKYLKDEYQELSLCRDEEGLVYDDLNQSEVYGLILVK